jgi:tRNA pseudouridine65 synthase
MYHPAMTENQRAFELEILYKDETLVAVNKPSGWDVHRNEFNRHRPIVLQALRNQINREVHPVHRLDGGTSGVLLFATDKDVLRFLSEQFTRRETTKIYHCVSRGFARDTNCQEPLRVHDNIVDAETDFRCLSQITLPWPNEKFPQSRYSLIEARPRTGRYHQIRRHLRHLAWPIVGDTKHGDGTHNILWRDNAGIERLMLHASVLEIKHPDGTELRITAPWPPEFGIAANLEGWSADFRDFPHPR